MKTSCDTVVIYHGQCADGLAAAWCFKAAGMTSVFFHAAMERDFFRDKDIPDLTRKKVFIVDFSYRADALTLIGQIAKSVTIYDHHQTAQQQLKTPIANVTTVFDLQRCGAEITWDALFPDAPRPWFFVHIRDRDLWEWKHPDSKGFGAHLWEWGLRFETLDFLNTLPPSQQEEFLRYGAQLVAFEEKEVQRQCHHAILVGFEGYAVYAINAVTYRSEIGHALASRPDCAFAVLFSYDLSKGQWRVSLRGVADKSPDLTDIAGKFGGGGHPMASGFSYKGDLSSLFQLRSRDLRTSAQANCSGDANSVKIETGG